MVSYVISDSGLGLVLVARSQIGVCAIALDEDRNKLIDWCLSFYPHATPGDDDIILASYLGLVQQYIESPSDRLDLPLDIQGTAFQKRVWQALQTVPTGIQLSYSELANMIGQPTAIRAVASACAANLLALAIPCHRIVKKDGSVSGYRWGVARKQRLLDMERALSR